MSGRFREVTVLKLKIIATGIIFAPLIYFAVLPLTVNVFYLIIFGPLSVLLYLAIYRLLGFFEVDDLRTLRHFYLPYLRQVASLGRRR